MHFDISLPLPNMKKSTIYLLIITALLTFSVNVQAQLLRKAETFISAVLSDSAKTNADSLTVDERYRREVERNKAIELELQQRQLHELQLQAELDKALHGNRRADSLKRAQQSKYIDSLRSLTPGVPVVVDNDTLFRLYAPRGGYSAADRAEMASEAIRKAGTDLRLRRDSVYLLDNESYVDIMCGRKVLVSITDKDALWQGMSRRELAELYMPLLAAKIDYLKERHSFWQIAKRVALFLLVILVQYALFRLTNFLFRKLRRRIIKFKQNKLKPVYVRDYEVLDTRRLGKILIFFNNLLRYIVLIIQLTFTVPMLFIIFPQTEALAMKILNYIIGPIKMVVKAAINYIPNLFIIIIIWLCIHYLIKGLRYIASEVENEKLKIAGFYPDWAQPTFNIMRFLLYAFMIAMIYPYLPGSQSGVFQGISVFVGLIVSLGSSTVIGNVIAGLVITYMRPYKVGDRIKLNDTTGNVVEKTPFVTRLRTPKNEVVTIPNSFIMSSHTVNYSESARRYGLIIHTTVTIGYDAPWRQVHQLLINAARLTPGVLEHPKPFVLETELSDYYPCYQINAYIKDADNYGPIMSDLHQNIQDIFNEAGVEIMSPHYYAGRDGNASTIPDDYLKTE